MKIREENYARLKAEMAQGLTPDQLRTFVRDASFPRAYWDLALARGALDWIYSLPEKPKDVHIETAFRRLRREWAPDLYPGNTRLG